MPYPCQRLANIANTYISRSLCNEKTNFIGIRDCFLKFDLSSLSKLVLQPPSSKCCLQMIEWSCSIRVCFFPGEEGLLNYTITWSAQLSQTTLTEAAHEERTVWFMQVSQPRWPYFDWQLVGQFSASVYGNSSIFPAFNTSIFHINKTFR